MLWVGGVKVMLLRVACCGFFVQDTSRKFSYGLLVCMLFCCCMQGVKLQLLVVFSFGVMALEWVEW